ncbi:MAG: phosphate starvation-inducible protein PhoH [Deltaproteobacteria bacterium RIFOXYD12_FULL_57_12]|nr:MAG: phosphate starvation-inducible protein PhoH [Deltaproteobacteria bacterium RIFOXYD12_FULL_57_12]
MAKYFVLDTNVLLHNAESIDSFADNFVVLPMTVIEELDKFKSHNDELGRNARQVIRRLDNLRSRGKLGEGVQMENGGTLLIVVEKDKVVAAHGLDMSVPDNRILAVANHLLQKKKRVIFVSKDISARLKADALGLEVMDFEKQTVNFDELFSGYREMLVPGQMIEDFFKNDVLAVESGDLSPNEFVLLVDQANEKHTGMGRFVQNIGLVHLDSRYDSAWNLRPRNKEQRMALELLMDQTVEVVTLVGQAGTGKTLLALAAGLETTVKLKQYDKLLVSRPIIPLGKDIGYLPGSKDDKLSLWMQPIFDNLTYLVSGDARRREDNGATSRQKVEKLLKDNVVELEALSYIRGRSIPRQYVIVDEAQNLTPHEVKTIISRAGEGTKVVLTGDPCQIDNPYLDSRSNGLAYAVERLKNQAVHGHITLRKSERSALAGIAAELL